MILGIVCEAFHCTPDVAVRLNPTLTFGVLEARAAEQAKRQHNTDVSRMTPGQMDLWRELTAMYDEG